MSQLSPSLRWIAYASANLVIAFLVLPILAVIPTSFNQASFITVPPTAWSWRWYEACFQDTEWQSALWVSIQIAVLATLIALAAGTPAAIGL